MTCDVCRKPERSEHLKPVLDPNDPLRLINACRRCRLPIAVRAHWDAMHARESELIADPERPGAITALRDARAAFDLAIRGVGKPPRKRRR